MKDKPMDWSVESEARARLSIVSDELTRCVNNSLTRQQVLLRFARLYENVAVVDYDPSNMASAFIQGLSSGNGVTYNVIQMCVDALNAKITKNSPRPMFLTLNGNWPDQMRARKLDRWCKGLFSDAEVYQSSREARSNASVFGDGYLQLFFNESGRIKSKSVSPLDLVFDHTQVPNGELTRVFKRSFIPTRELAMKYPAADLRIPDGSYTSGDLLSFSSHGEVTEVWEAWTLGSGKNPGKYVKFVKAQVILEESGWKACVLPFVHIRHSRRTMGPFGKGLAETLMGTQIELNKMCNSISRQFQRKGKGRLYVEKGSINLRHLTNAEGGDIVEYAVGSRPPSMDTTSAIPLEDHQHVKELVDRALRMSGLSEMAVSARKPAGLDAAVALREYSDLESERFAVQHKDWDDFFLRVAKLGVEMAKACPGGYKVKVPGRRTVEEIDWKNVNLDQDAYMMQMFPTSALPQTPAARKAQVTELRDAGFISPDVAKRLLDFPDIEAEMTLGTAQIDDVDATISAILDEDTPQYKPPEPVQNLALLLERAITSYLHVRHFKNIEDSRLDMLMKLITEVESMLKAVEEQAAVAAMAAQPPPQGAPV